MVGGRSALAAEVPWTPLRPCFLNDFLEVGGAVTLPGHAGRLHEERLSLGLIELKPADDAPVGYNADCSRRSLATPTPPRHQCVRAGTGDKSSGHLAVA